MTKRGVQFTSSWYGFEHLRFLLNRKKYRRELSSDTNVINNSEREDPQVQQTNNLSNVSTSKRPTDKITPKRKNVDTVNRQVKLVDTVKRQIKSADTDNQIIKSAYSIASTSNSVKDVFAKPATDSPVTDADQTYANFIATKFRMYSQQTKNVLQYKISNLLFQADTGVFDNDQNYDTFQEKPRARGTASRQPRANESDSSSSSSENKRARRTSSEDRSPISIKIEDNSDLEDPLNDYYENLI